MLAGIPMAGRAPPAGVHPSLVFLPAVANRTGDGVGAGHRSRPHRLGMGARRAPRLGGVTPPADARREREGARV
jgi:hypothetical protein